MSAISLLLVGSATAFLGYWLVRGGLLQPITLGAAALFAIAGMWRSRAVYRFEHEDFFARTILSGIVGGVLGQAISLLVAPELTLVSMGFLWFAIGMLGIGGALGLGTGLLAALGITLVEIVHMMQQNIKWARHAT